MPHYLGITTCHKQCVVCKGFAIAMWGMFILASAAVMALFIIAATE